MPVWSRQLSFSESNPFACSLFSMISLPLSAPFRLFFLNLPAAKSRNEKRDPPLFSFWVSPIPDLDAYEPRQRRGSSD